MHKISSHKQTIMLDEKGFVFIDDKNMPYWVAMRYEKPMLAYWHADKRWVNLRELNGGEVMLMNQKAISEEYAEIYHEQHKANSYES